LTDEGERLRGLLAQVHGHGRTESPELADLIDEEAALLAKAVTEPCTPGSVGCRLSEQARQLVKAEALPKMPPHGRTALGDWLSGLQLPEIGLKDDPRVRSIVKFHTENPVGREMFQVLLFQCGAHRDLFHESLTRRGLPLDLIALVMVESGCVGDAESPVGARGLWQFMPATARAYHLRVQAGVIDERLSAAKATDAALRFLGDLYRKLGSWELALASYNMGPFGLLARLRQAGGDADYWDLVDAGRLPNETANYVPKIEAFALILANLDHFRFEAAQQKSAEASVELSVPAGTRLGLVARAAASSTIKIRELNPELMGDTAPGRSGESFSLRVPREAAPRAREALERLIAQADDADECVPHGFDWGRQRFTRTMLSRCRR
jgi:membrane-bound lytic murein transglycosylase D